MTALTMNTPRPKSPSAESPHAEQPPRLFASLRQLAITLLGMAHTRMALAGVELEEELQRLIGLLLSMLGLLVFGLVGVLMFTLMVVLAVDAAQRVVVLAFFAASYLGFGGWFWWRIQRVLATRPPFCRQHWLKWRKTARPCKRPWHPVRNAKLHRESQAMNDADANANAQRALRKQLLLMRAATERAEMVGAIDATRQKVTFSIAAFRAWP
ncbi:phage holin family protein [Polaromonas sp. P1(28)-8]|nr:phage holin family protein [Polaromonas sp. P1(28)-8]